MKNIENRIEDAVGRLPEVYQPIYGYENKFVYKRESLKCFSEIEEVCKNLQRHFNRKLNIVDVGCAQGYLTLNLSKYCKNIIGIDTCRENINLCNILKKKNEIKNIDFMNIDVTKYNLISKYDVIILCNVLHHICHQSNAEITLNILRKISSHSRVIIMELANVKENQDWSACLPKNNKYFTEIFNFSNEINEFKNHLNKHKRKLYIGSNKYLYIKNNFYCFEKKLKYSHKYDRNINNEIKKYYFSNDKIIKHYKNCDNNIHYKELIREKAFYNLYSLNKNIAELHHCFNSTFFIRKRVEGVLLYEYLDNACLDDKILLVKKIIDKLSYYENLGYYHNDLRLWNILIDSKKNIHIIDYSSFQKSRNDVLGYSIFFSLSILLTEIFNLEYLHFPFRLLPDIKCLPNTISSLVIYILVNHENVKFIEISKNYNQIINNPFSYNIHNYLLELNTVNKNLLSYYHNNQQIGSDYKKIKKSFKRFSKNYNYYESSYHHLNKVIKDINHKNVSLLNVCDNQKKELFYLSTKLYWIKIFLFLILLVFTLFIVI